MDKKYTYYLNSLFDYMVKNGYTKLPKPRILLNTSKQDEVFGKTGNYDPENRIVRVFVKDRFFKDILRSAAHEFIHHKQNVEGRLGEGSYSGDRIVDDNKLINLEKEAYLDGNIAFRSWTEVMNKK